MSKTETTTGAQTLSIKVDDMSLDQLVLVSQGLGREIDKLKEKRAYLKRKIDERLARGERNGAPPDQAKETGVDAEAPGAILEAKATH